MRAINRELTIRGIKERVDLLIGYFRQQDTVNLRKSGTEKQYGEREQLLQDVSDLIREVDYAPRTVPRKANGVGPRQPAQQLASAKARRAQALLIRDAAMASLPTVRASDDGQKNDEATATNMLLEIYEDELSHPPHRGDGTAGDRTTTSPAGEVPAAAPGVPAAAPAQDTLETETIEDSDADQDSQGGNAAHDAQGPLLAPERRRYRQSAVPTGI
ncbi:uncharacterized protein LOC142765794 [Rhipicephalus microplus]|uniref:uncharacterized protein LOC142765794 n=1 Tax=Rhipicephalus microplus TaxID=6941 RepID=UPI003F6B8651